MTISPAADPSVVLKAPALRERSVGYRILAEAMRNTGFRVGLGILLLIVLASAIYPEVTSLSATKISVREKFLPPILFGEKWSFLHPLGTDQLGRDMLLRCLIGLRYSFFIGVTTVVLMFCVGCALGLVAGYKGGGVHFDTAGERIVIGPIDPTAANNAMTLAAWINWEGRNHSISQQGIIGKRLGWSTTGATIKWFWQTNPAGDFLFRADYDGGGTSFGWGNALLVPYANEWVHVAVTWDNGAGVQYINGEQVSTGSATLRESANATPVTIGCVDSSNDETFVGTIDEVRTVSYTHLTLPTIYSV